MINVGGLSSLTRVGHPNAGLEISGRIEISDNPKLVNLDGFSSLSSMNGPISIINNASLETIDGFSGVYGVELALSISNNPRLKSFNGFKNLGSMRGPLSVALTIANNPALTNIDGISSLRSMTGKSGSIIIENNASLTNIDGLSAFSVMPTAGGTVRIVNNPSLKNIDGLVSFTSVGINSLTHLIIENNASLKNLNGLSSIRIFNPLPSSVPDVIVHITKNPSLSSCEGLYPLLSSMGPEIISELTALGNIDVSENGSGCTVEDILANGPPSTVFEGDVTLSTQAEVDAFHYNKVTGGLTISGNDITNVDALSALTFVKSLKIAGNTSLRNVNGLSALGQVGFPEEGGVILGFIDISNNPMLANVDGFSSLSNVYGPITIDNNESLETINGFSGLTIVRYELIISNNRHLKSLDGFKHVTSIWRGYFVASLIIDNNASLTNIDGLSSITSVYGKGSIVRITNNAMLRDVDGLSSLRSFSPYGSGLEISHNPSLKNIDGLRLTWFGNNSLFSLTIHDNASLENLDGLSSIRLVIPESYTSMGVHITKNPSLSNCDGLFPLLTYMGPDIVSELTALGNINVSENGSGCTVEEIMANGPPIVVNFKLIDLKTGTILNSFLAGASAVDIDVAHLNLQDLGLEAVTFPQQVGRVVFTVDDQYKHTENYFRYVLPLRHLDIGTHTIQADVYSKFHGRSKKGIGRSIDLNIKNSAQITSFELVDTSGKSLKPLNNGDKIDLKDPMFKDFSIRAITWPDRVSFVKFWVNGQHVNTERVPPYALAGDINSAYNPWRPTPGHYTLLATPYIDVGGKQYAGQSLEVQFEVVREKTIAVVGYDIVNTSGHFLRHLNEGDVLDLNDLKHHGQTIVANTKGKVGSVKFDLNNQYFNIENVFPYTFTGDHNGHFNSWVPKAGTYTLTATPFLQANAGGNVGKPLTITFTVADKKNNANARMPVIDAAEQGNVSDLTIYPVPVEHELFVKACDAAGSDAQLSIFTLQGFRVYEGTYMNSSRISVTDFKPGVYIIRVIGKNGFKKELKFIKK